MTQVAQPTHPLDGVDDLGEAVLLGLSRPAGWKQSPRPIQTAMQGLITFGIVPILHWQTLFGMFAVLEQQQFEHLAEWVRKSGREREGEQLIKSAILVRPSGWRRGLIYLLTFMAGAILMGYFCSRNVHWIVGRSSYAMTGRHLGREFELTFCVLMAGFILASAYLIHWSQVAAYTKSAERFAAEFGRLVKVPHEPTPMHVANIVRHQPSKLWVVPACLLPFGPFMAMAGINQATAFLITSRVRRAGLAMQLKALRNAPMPFPMRRRCENQLCEAMLEANALYCARCGARA